MSLFLVTPRFVKPKLRRKPDVPLRGRLKSARKYEFVSCDWVGRRVYGDDPLCCVSVRCLANGTRGER